MRKSAADFPATAGITRPFSVLRLPMGVKTPLRNALTEPLQLPALRAEVSRAAPKERRSFLQLPATTVRELGRELMEKLPLKGIKVIGSLDSPVSKVWIPGHVMGMHDNDVLKTMEEDDIDTLIVFECIDYTVTEYVRDSTQAGRPKTILAVGHFNTEEPGMQYMTGYLPAVLGEGVSCSFIPSTDMYEFLTK